MSSSKKPPAGFLKFRCENFGDLVVKYPCSNSEEKGQFLSACCGLGAKKRVLSVKKNDFAARKHRKANKIKGFQVSKLKNAIHPNRYYTELAPFLMSIQVKYIHQRVKIPPRSPDPIHSGGFFIPLEDPI